MMCKEKVVQHPGMNSCDGEPDCCDATKDSCEMTVEMLLANDIIELAISRGLMYKQAIGAINHVSQILNNKVYDWVVV